MMLYAVAVLPLICFLKTPGKWTQNWYADDSSRVAKIFAFFANLVCGILHRGSDYGYHLEPSKKVLGVGLSDFQQASELFAE